MGYKPNSGTHQANIREPTLWFSSQRREARNDNAMFPGPHLKLFILRGQTETQGPKIFVCSIFRPWCKLLKLWGFLISRNCKACRITAPQKWLQTPLSPGDHGRLHIGQAGRSITTPDRQQKKLQFWRMTLAFSWNFQKALKLPIYQQETTAPVHWGSWSGLLQPWTITGVAAFFFCTAVFNFLSLGF